MWSCRASSEVLFPLRVALGLSLLDCGDKCPVMESQGVFSAKFSAARTPSEDKALGLPDTLEGCVRLNWGLEHRMTPAMFLTIGLQCLDKLRNDLRLRLKSVEQIQFKEKRMELEVVIDPAYSVYPEEPVAVTRACMTEQMLSRLATFVSADEHEYPVEVIALCKRYAGNTVFTMDLLGLGEEPRTLDGIEKELRIACQALSSQPGKYWRGVCRPRLGLSTFHDVAIIRSHDGKLCQECEPRNLSDLRPSQRIRSLVDASLSGDGTPTASILPSDGTPEGRTWSQIMNVAAERVRTDTNERCHETVQIPIERTWKPWHQGYMRKKHRVEAHLQSQLERGCLIQLQDLLKTYRLTNKQCHSLVHQLRSLLKGIAGKIPDSEKCCVGSYAQVYVSLDESLREILPDFGTKLRVVLTPECMKASSKQEANEITQKFIKRLCDDADCEPFVSKKDISRALALNSFFPLV
ncbi:hypothetical protein GNI_173470 [Gregarina niphandrodes]|uniref:Uncharacterized protein n=1 Tax=Gregarina niphandrodes TaxID=110365 RepID=A0A023AXN2_GRENI|nr:hypothetical protein GNI_173470 [Gregarina niphandrodes]EZG43401.1 hypothetical protein GNI_173470 [Gregarina niphandrodes]|eukprot:XP_011133367.1 hypothetical protein GNI_173470 [Gregarina niphandrodes]